jgi:putative ABC transport system permease protein
MVAALAVGTGATLALFALVYHAFVAPLPYPDAERLVWLSERHAEIPERPISYPNFLDWQARSEGFEVMAAVGGAQGILRGRDDARAVEARIVTADYFRVLRVAPLLGRDFAREDDLYGAAPTALISHALWQAEFRGSPDVVGTDVALNDGTYRIIGVLPASLHLPGDPDVWTPRGLQAAPDGPLLGRSNRNAGYVLARLKEGTSPAQARADMRRVAGELASEYPIHNAGHEIEIRTLRESLVGDVRLPLLLSFGAVGVLLLLVCTNVSNLLLVRVIGRRAELALRAALGADRRRILAGVLAESGVLAVLGTAGGLLIAAWAAELVARFAPRDLVPFASIAVGWPVILFAGALALVLAAIIGVLPTWQGLSRDLTRSLGAGAKTTEQRSSTRLRDAAVVLQSSLAVALLIGASLLIDSIVRIAQSDHGFRQDGVLTFKLLTGARYATRAQATQFHAALVSAVGSVPGVASAAIQNELPGLEPTWQTDISPEIAAGQYQRITPGNLINVDWGIVSDGYFATMGTPLLRGRDFTAAEAGDGSPVMVIDENLANRFWPAGDALGRHIKYDSATPIEIIGIAANARAYGDARTGRVKIYTPYGRFPLLGRVTVAVRANGVDTASLVAPIRQAVRSVDPSIPMFDVATLGDRLAERMATRTLTTWIVSTFAGLAVLLAALGIHAVMSFVVAQRVRELGIRVALGAQPRDILRLVVGRGALLAGAGVALGLVLGGAVTRFFSAMLFGVTATNAPIYVGVSALFLAIAVTACFMPAWRAVKLDPTAALKTE